jgi:hypothetical protein
VEAPDAPPERIEYRDTGPNTTRWREHIGRAALGLKRQGAHQKRASQNMLSRTATSSIAGRGSSMRRLRRRASASSAAYRPYCGTNGCTSFLVIDAEGRAAQCPICGFVRRVG